MQIDLLTLLTTTGIRKIVLIDYDGEEDCETCAPIVYAINALSLPAVKMCTCLIFCRHWHKNSKICKNVTTKKFLQTILEHPRFDPNLGVYEYGWHGSFQRWSLIGMISRITIRINLTFAHTFGKR